MERHNATPGFNDLLTVKPELAAEWDFELNTALNPHKLKPHANKLAWWRCAKDHSWQAGVNSRTAGNGCPYCSNQRVLAGYNDIATTHPHIAAEWDFFQNDGLLPTEVLKGTHKKVWWIGKCGHSYIAAVYHRCSDDGLATDCPFCAGKKVLTGFNDLETLNPTLAAEWDYTKNETVTPQTISAGTHKKYWWNGVCGHSWKADVYSRNYESAGCPICKNLKVVTGENDLAHLSPKIAAEWDDEMNGELKPENVASKSDTFVWWICSKGHR
jgi:hypothetical protein